MIKIRKKNKPLKFPAEERKFSTPPFAVKSQITKKKNCNPIHITLLGCLKMQIPTAIKIMAIKKMIIQMK